MTVSYRDGIEIELSDGTRVVCDANNPDGDIDIVSHAHADHLPDGDATAVCSELTAELGTVRREGRLTSTSDERVELLPAGHIAGSTVALITDPDGTTYLYTGDVCTRSRFYLDGFDPPEADVLITEATYGEPEYVFPDHDSVVASIMDWFDEQDEQPAILFGYALGRAQKLQLVAEQAGRTVYTTDAVRRVNEPIERHLDVTFAVDQYESETTLGPGDALVLPMTTGRIDWIDSLVEESGAVKAGFSGWALDQSFRYRRELDVGFPLSDHCDFDELCDLVLRVDPDEVYTQHGSGDTLADHLTSQGYSATTIKQNQTSLTDF